MALKGPLWLMARCLEEERARGRLGHLASRALDLGLRKAESTRGHVFQATGAVQEFLIEHPEHKATIRRSPALDPHKPRGKVLRDWAAFIRGHPGAYGRGSFGYDYDTLRGYLTKKYGGRRTGGGGGDNEFEIVLRLVAEFLD
jgi:hypothetical protein